MNQSTKGDKRTCTLALHKFVMPPIFEPDTPGGFRASMDWSKFSSSATAEDMAGNTTVKSECKGSRKRKKKRVPRQGFMQMGNNRERERDPGYCAL
jgi:hypothetical protein